MRLFSGLRLPYREDALFSTLVFLVFLVPLIFAFQLYEKFESIKFASWLVIFGAAFFIFCKEHFGRSGAGSFVRNRSRILAVLLGVFVLACVVVSFFSINPPRSWLGSSLRFDNGIVFYMAWSATVLLLVYVTDRSRLYYLAQVLVFDALLVSAVGVLQSFGVGFYEGADTHAFLRAPSLLGNPNFSTMFLACVLPFGLTLFFIAKSFTARVYYGLAGFAMLACMLLLSSRGAWLALATSLFSMGLLFALLRFERKYMLALLGAVAVAVGLWYGFMQVVRPDSYSPSTLFSQFNITSRLYVWDIARQGIYEHPLTGIGLGNFQVLFEEKRAQNLSDLNGVYDDPHNFFLMLASTGGLVVAGLFILLLTVALVRAYSAARRERDLIFAACFASLVAFIVAACFTPVSTGCMLILAVAVAGSFTARSEQYTIRPARTWSVFGMGLAMVFTAVGFLFISSELLFFRAYNNYFLGDFETSYRQSALAARLNPFNLRAVIYQAGSAANLGDVKETERGITRMVALEGQDANTYFSSSNIYLSLFGATKDQSFLKKSSQYMTEALLKDRYLGIRYGFMGYLQLLLGNQQQALFFTKTSLTLSPKEIPTWMLLARVYQTLDMGEQMRYALDQAFQLSPSNNLLKLLNETARKQQDITKVPIPVGIIPNALE